MATETINRICDVLASGVCPVPEDQAKEPINQVPLSSSSSEDEAEGGNDNDNDDEKLDTSKSEKNLSVASDSKITLVIDSVNLSGPVTDL
ncbi:hypothetical protein ALC53_09734 [Atta colombica]|uniref:Uncharacterized protein n=1 Tax=Atta colombica TaxID=520822 RepID=A0A195B6C1_9HYME|nr:hypothetical protein ALC53_09734 [Atta colombica]